jgi:hypothetical protein
MTMSDQEFLLWLANRLERAYIEDPRIVDRVRAIAEHAEADI